MTLQLDNEWDKTFPKNENVNHKKVSFKTRFGTIIAADQYEPKECSGKLAAIAVSGPFGAVKEQVSGRYAQELASRGFLTIAFDPSHYGESTGEPRGIASPDINTEDFQAAIDYLSVQDNADPEKIGAIGICGWGGMVLNTAQIDTRIKAIVASTMYDMSRISHWNYNDTNTADEVYEMKKSLNVQRIEDFKNDTYATSYGVPPEITDDMPQFVKDYYDFYRTPRGFHKRSLGSTTGFNTTSSLSLINTPQLAFADEIRNPVLLVHGENAHSRYFSETAFEQMTGKKPEIPEKLTEAYSKIEGNKEIYIVPGAVHCDLYDNLDKIPFDKIESFLKKNLEA